MTKRTATILLAVLGLLLAACGSSDTTTDAGDQLGSAVESDGGDGGAGGDGSGTDGDGGSGGAADGSGGSDGDSDGADGGGDDAGGDSMAGTLRSTVLGAALDETGAMTSASFEGVITIVGQPGSDLPGEFTMTFSGAFDNEAEASVVSIDFGNLFEAAAAADPEAADGMGELFATFFEEPMQMITIGDTSWVKWGLLAMFGVDDRWLQGDASNDSLAGDFGIGGGSDSPTAMLEELADSDAEIQDLGQEDLRGITTTHYRAELDVATLAEQMSAEERAEFESELGASAEGSYVIDLWIDENDLLHRFVLSVDDLAATGEDELGSMTMTYDLWDHGLDQGIAAPPADEVITEEELGFTLEDLGGFSG